MQEDPLPAKPQEKPKNIGVGSLSFLPQIFPTQELNRGLLHCRQILYQLSYEGRPKMEYLMYKSSKMCVRSIWGKLQNSDERYQRGMK